MSVTAHDLLAREFAPATGCLWCGIDLARLSRDELVDVAGTLGNKSDVAGLDRDALMRLIIGRGNMQGLW